MAALAAVATGLTDAMCGNDWLQIPCASDQMNSVYTIASIANPTGPVVGCVNKLCGTMFSALTAGAASAPVYSNETFECILYIHYNKVFQDTHENFS